MSVRIFEYTLSEEGINPSTIAKGGVQGEHNATKIKFTLEPDLESAITKIKEEVSGSLYYRFDVYDGLGEVIRSEPQVLESDEISYLLGNNVTQHGGTIQVFLIITCLKEDKTELELYSYAVKVQLKALPEGEEAQGENYESLTTLAQVAKTSAETAVAAKEIAVEAQTKTEEARACLEGGTEWIFDGGGADNEVGIELIVDSQMSDVSENPVKNKAIKAYTDGEIEALKKLVEEKLIEEISKAKEEALNKAKLEAHPIGSYYWSSEATSPSELFGGTWAQVEGKFILAAGSITDKNDTYQFEVGSIGGEVMHKLVQGELPKIYGSMSFHGDGTGSVLYSASGVIGAANLTNAYATSEVNTNANSYAVAELKFGADEAHNNMPPYEVAYCWKRTA